MSYAITTIQTPGPGPWMGRGGRLVGSGPIWLPRWAAAGVGGLGETSNWLGLVASPSEVYLVRLAVKGARLDTPDDAKKFARAVGSLMSDKLDLDVRGVAVWGSASDRHVDVILTSDDSRVSLITPSNDGIKSAVEADPTLRAGSPTFSVTSAELLQLTGPPDAIDHWRSQPILWDRHLGPGSSGGPTDTFATPAEYSIVLGKADDGKRSSPWRAADPGLGPDAKKNAASAWPWVLGILAAVAVSYHFGKEKRR